MIRSYKRLTLDVSAFESPKDGQSYPKLTPLPGGGTQKSFIRGGSARSLKPLPFNILTFYKNGAPFIYLEQSCTPFLYLKDKPKQ